MNSLIRSLSRRLTSRRDRRTREQAARHATGAPEVIHAQGVDAARAIHCKILLLDHTDMTIAVNVSEFLVVDIHSHCNQCVEKCARPGALRSSYVLARH